MCNTKGLAVNTCCEYWSEVENQVLSPKLGRCLTFKSGMFFLENQKTKNMPLSEIKGPATSA